MNNVYGSWRVFLLLCLISGIPLSNTAAAASPPFSVKSVTEFDEPWAMSFLPDGQLLVTEKYGRLMLLPADFQGRVEVAGVPNVAYGGQGGLGDVVVHPRFRDNHLVYISYAEAGSGNTRGAAVMRAELARHNGGARLINQRVIWRQHPKVSGSGHYGHRLAFAANGDLFITSGERQKFDPAQDLRQNLGKVLRLEDDGSIPAGNPFASQGDVAQQVWSYGHRNPLGIAFDSGGRLWIHEMGPRGGDELNLIEKGENYGYPLVSNGDHYSGRDIPDHATRPDLKAPAISWTPVISPAGFIIYSGALFPRWRGSGFIGALSAEALIRVEFDGTRARETDRWPFGKRIRDVEQGPDGAIWLLEDGSNARLLRLSPDL